MCKDATKRQKKQTVSKQRGQMKKDLLFKVGGKPIKIVETFKSLGKVTANSDDDEEAVKRNLGRARGNGQACGGSSFKRTQDQKRWQCFTEQWCCVSNSVEASLGC
jgi:hypothetical protein